MKKGLLVCFDLVADLSLVSLGKYGLKALSWNHDDCYKECMWLKPVLFSF